MGRRIAASLSRLTASICLVLLGSAVVSLFAPAVAAQTGAPAIRVESNEVLVPVLVLDKRRVAKLRDIDPVLFLREAESGNYAAFKDIAVSNLDARDFRVFEDGRKQKIERVVDESEAGPPVLKDNLSRYAEFVGVGGGTWVWSAPLDLPRILSLTSIFLPGRRLSGYLVAYAPPPSPSGSCHTVSVKVNRPKSIVYARQEYCDTKNSAADPLKGTKLGNKLEYDLSSRKKGKLNLATTTFASLSPTGKSPVHVYVEFPHPKHVRFNRVAPCSETPTIGIIGAVYTGNGTLARRFSDFLSSQAFANVSFAPVLSLLPFIPSGYCVSNDPSRYQTQILLPPGQYSLQLAVIDGKEFGRANARFTVSGNDGGRLAISGIVLARRFRKTSPDQLGAATETPEDYTPLISRGFEVIPTPDSSFPKGEPLCFFFQVYDPRQTDHVEAHLRIVDAKTGTVVKQIGPLDAAQYRTPGDLVVPIGGGISTNDLLPGSYRLEVQATSSENESTGWQVANFTIQ